MGRNVQIADLPHGGGGRRQRRKGHPRLFREFWAEVVQTGSLPCPKLCRAMVSGYTGSRRAEQGFPADTCYRNDGPRTSGHATGKGKCAMAADLLQKELDTYEAHKADLLTGSAGKYVLIRGDEVIGTYVVQADAIAEGYRRFGNVPFLVKEVTEIDEPVNFARSMVAN